VGDLPTIDPSILCQELTLCLDLDKLSILLPGGYNLQGQVSQDVPDCLDTARGLLSSLNSALGPLNVIFLLVQCIQDLQDVVKAIGPPPDPVKLAKALDRLETDVSKLLGVAPPLSVPKLIKSVVGMLLVLLRGIVDQLANLVNVETAIEVVADRASSIAQLPNGEGTFAAAQLLLSVGCAKATLASQISGLSQGLSPLNALLEFLNQLMQVAGLSQVLPLLEALDSSSVSVNIPPLNDAIALLEIIFEAIP
jgi:hypothetical protein